MHAARQSGIDAVSAGEWDTPVGLRTKSIAVGIPMVERIPASCPAAVGMMGQSPSSWSAAIRAARSGSKATAPETDSAVTETVVPSRSARSVACLVIVSTSSDRASSDEHRASSQASTREGTALVPLGVTSRRPNVARWPASRACLLAASAVIA